MIAIRFGRKALIVAFLFLVSADIIVHTQPAPPAEIRPPPLRTQASPRQIRGNSRTRRNRSPAGARSLALRRGTSVDSPL